MSGGYQTDILANLVPHLEVWWGVLLVIITMIGLALTVSGLLGLASARPGGGGKKAFLTLLAGAVLLNAPELLDALSQTLLGGDSADLLSYRPPAHAAAGYLRVAVLAVGLVGLVGVARGVCILRLTGGEGGGLPRALAHIVGGVLCVNLTEFLKILAATFGGDVEAVVSALVG